MLKDFISISTIFLAGSFSMLIAEDIIEAIDNKNLTKVQLVHALCDIALVVICLFCGISNL